MPNKSTQQLRWHRLDNTALIAQLMQTANAAIEARGAFHISLAGGRTPQALYRQLCDIDTDWRRWFIYFGDERCLPRGDAERNDTQARVNWLDHVSIPPTQIFSMPAEQGAEQGAAAYSAQLAALDQFDLVLLGLGEDGHTASLFPGDVLNGQSVALAVYDAPKPPPERISLSASRLSAARAVWFLVTGADKREGLLRWRRGEDLPAAHIAPAAGVDIYTDIAVDD